MPTVLIAGGTGLIGSRLSKMLQEKDYAVLHLSRRERAEAPFTTYFWDLKKGYVEEEAIEKADYIINLAGANIAAGRWTLARKQHILDSRVDSTLLLKEYIKRKTSPLKAYVSASAVGFYGDRGSELVRESDPAGEQGFLAATVRKWEEVIGQVSQTGVRTITLRIGVVLSTRGGALKKIMLPFRFFTGTYFGDGGQFMPWIHIDDLCRMFITALESESWQGVYNAAAPHPVSNKELVFTLKKALRKPALILPVPEFALRLAIGEMADVVFESARTSADKAGAAGFSFHFPELLPALDDLLHRKI